MIISATNIKNVSPVVSVNMFIIALNVNNYFFFKWKHLFLLHLKIFITVVNLDVFPSACLHHYYCSFMTFLTENLFLL